MTFTYPAVFTPKRRLRLSCGISDLECCEADGPDLEDAIDNAAEAAYNWIWKWKRRGVRASSQTHEGDLELEEGQFVRRFLSESSFFRIMISHRVKLSRRQEFLSAGFLNLLLK